MIKDLLPWKKKEKNNDLVKYDNNDMFGHLHRQMNELFDNFFEDMEPNKWLPSFSKKGSFSPNFDVNETKNEINIKAELPGMDEKDISVDVFDDYIRIKGEKKEEKETNNKKSHISECHYGYFERSLPIYDNIDKENIKANFKKGVLKVKLPKLKEEPSKTKKISIS